MISKEVDCANSPDPMEIEFEVESVEVIGRVSDELQNGLSGAKILARSMTGSDVTVQLHAHAASDSHGDYKLGLLRPSTTGRVMVTAELAGYAMRELSFVPAEGQQFRCDIVLVRRTFVEGRLMDEIGRPLAGSLIKFYRTGTLEIYGVVESDAEGRFLVDFSKGTLILSGHARGFARTTLTLPTPELPTGPVELRLQRGRSLRGHVVSDSGEVLVDVEVMAVLSNKPEALAKYSRDIVDDVARTDKDGNFTMSSLSVSTYSLVVRVPGDEEAEFKVVSPATLEISADTQQVTITVHKR